MDRTALRNKYAIAGVGYTPQGKVPGRSAASFYLEASMNAIKDAGLRKEDIDGFILYRDFPILKGDAFHHTANVITKSLGIRPNFLSQESYCYRTFLHKAIGAIEAGACNYVLVVFAESGRTGHRTWTDEIDTFSDKPYDEYAAYGNISAFTNYAFFCQPRDARVRHRAGRLERDRRGAPPLGQPQPHRQLLQQDPSPRRTTWPRPASPGPSAAWTPPPPRTAGAPSYITTAERAKELKNPLVTIRGFGVFNDTSKGWQLTPGDPRSSALIAGKLAYEMAGLSPKDIGAAQIYDCYTYTVEATLADYGFYDRKKSRDFLTVENIGPGGDFPVNTGGGLLAEGYYMGLTPLAEGVMQMSGRCGDRQLGVMPGTKLPEFMIISDNGGYYNSNETMILERG